MLKNICALYQCLFFGKSFIIYNKGKCLYKFH
nr:MAG TPA: hypothetical protein [Caudoviricetes sp.]